MEKTTNFEIDFSQFLDFDWIELYYVKREIDIGITAFRTLSLNQEAALTATKEKFKESLKNDPELTSLPEEQRGSYYEAMYEIEEMTIHDLQRRQRYAILLTIFSFFEGRLKSICIDIEKIFTFKIKLDDLNNREDLMLYWNYLLKVFEIKIESIEPSFTPIKQQKAIRNIIAHHDGKVYNGQKDKIKKVLTNVPGINLEKEGYDYDVIEIKDTSYILDILSNMETFFEKLLTAIDKRYRELNN